MSDDSHRPACLTAVSEAPAASKTAAPPMQREWVETKVGSSPMAANIALMRSWRNAQVTLPLVRRKSGVVFIALVKFKKQAMMKCNTAAN